MCLLLECAVAPYVELAILAALHSIKSKSKFIGTSKRESGQFFQIKED